MMQPADVIHTFEADFLAQYRSRLTADQQRALTAMKLCRTPAAPMLQVRCTGCAHQFRVPHSCGHRHCPHCQHHESQCWLERQLQRLVPAPYFLLTFTLPAEFRALARAHPGIVFDRLLRCAWETVQIFSQNDRQLAGTPGAIAVLHTHTRRLDYHPHVHVVVPAAALDAAKQRWRTKRRGKTGGAYLFNGKALAKVFRGKLLAALEMSGLALPAGHPREWVAHCKAVGSGDKALIYLGRYLYRGVIREEDILACQNGQVTFRFRNAQTGKAEKRSLHGADFLWLTLQHVPPKGFRRAGNYGFLHPNCKRLIALLQVLLKVDPGRAGTLPRERPPILCACCGAVMAIARTRIRAWRPPAAGVEH